MKQKWQKLTAVLAACAVAVSALSVSAFAANEPETLSGVTTGDLGNNIPTGGGV